MGAGQDGQGQKESRGLEMFPLDLWARFFHGIFLFRTAVQILLPLNFVRRDSSLVEKRVQRHRTHNLDTSPAFHNFEDSSLLYNSMR